MIPVLDNSKEKFQFLIDDILQKKYPLVFSNAYHFASINSDLLQALENRVTDNFGDALCNAIEALYHKEKIVQFPFLLSVFPIANPSSDYVKAMNQTVEDGIRISKMIENFESYLNNIDTNSIHQDSLFTLKKCFTETKNAWHALCKSKALIYTYTGLDSFKNIELW